MDDLDFRRVHSHIVDQIGKYNAVVTQLMTARGWVLGLLAPILGGIFSAALCQDVYFGLILLCVIMFAEIVVLWRYSNATSPAYILQYPYRAALGSIFLFDPPITLEPIQALDGPMWKKLTEKYTKLNDAATASKFLNIDIETQLAVEIIRDLRRESVLRSSVNPK